MENWKKELTKQVEGKEMIEAQDKKDDATAVPGKAVIIGPKNQKRQKTFKCDIRRCNATYTTKYALRRHIEAEHYKWKNFICTERNCNKSFSLE